MILAVLILFVASYVVVSMTLLDEEWLRVRIERYVRDTYQTDLKIGSLEFEPWQGRARLSQVAIVGQRQNQSYKADIGALKLQMKVWPLLMRQVSITRIEVQQPALSMKVSRPPEAEPEPTLKRAVDLTAKVVADAIGAVLDTIFGSPKYQVQIGKLLVTEGSVDVTVTRPGSEPVVVTFKDIDYSAGGIVLESPLDLVERADITANASVNGIQGKLDQHFSSQPYSLDVSNMDLGRVDKLLKQKDALILEQGRADARLRWDQQKVNIAVELGELKVSQNPDAPQQDFMFIPVDKLISYVDSAGGHLQIAFAMNQGKVRTSKDLEFVVLEVWEGMWKALLRQVSSEKLKAWKEKGSGRLRDFFNRTTTGPEDEERSSAE